MDDRFISTNQNASTPSTMDGLPELQHAPQLTQSALIRVYVLTTLGVISLVGNVAIIFHFFKTRPFRRSSRKTWSTIYVLILHLSVADLFVTVFCIFGEAAWNYTVAWVAGELACKIVKFSQMFGLYLSTYVLVLIGIDRWTAVKYPMQSLHMLNRCYRCLAIVYILSMILSAPQYFIFTVSRGPFIETFYQCVTYGTYTAPWQEKLYAMFTLIFMFIIPLSVLIYTYVSTFRAIVDSEKSFQLNSMRHDFGRNPKNRQRLLNRAKIKSFRISVAIVAAFIICWTPYYVTMIIILFMDPDERFGDDLMSAIFFFGMANSVVNPLIYGAFSLWPLCKRRKQNNSIRYNNNSNHNNNNNNNNNNQNSFAREGSQNAMPSMTTMMVLKLQKNLKHPMHMDINTNRNCHKSPLVPVYHLTK